MTKETVDLGRQNIIQADAITTKPTRHYRARIFQAYLVSAVIVFIILAVLAKTIAYFTFDVTITHAVQNFNVWWFDAIMDVLSWIGYAPQAWIISVIILLSLLIIGLKWETLVGSFSVIGMSLLASGIKLIVERQRPSPDLVNVVSHLNSYSFPSGHVLYFTTFAGFLLFLAYTLLKASWWRTALLIVLGGMIALIGASRIYEGHHWASDVIGAYLLGSVWLSLSIYIYRWGKPRYFVNQPVAKETPP